MQGKLAVGHLHRADLGRGGLIGQKDIQGAEGGDQRLVQRENLGLAAAHQLVLAGAQQFLKTAVFKEQAFLIFLNMNGLHMEKPPF